jgi:hypothetical protein
MTARSTHVVEVADGHVIKRFRSWNRGEHQREWQALNVLAEFAPSLAPVPLSADLDADPPTITMTRLPGVPLVEQPIAARHLDALVVAMNSCMRAFCPAPSPTSSRIRGSPKVR